MAWLCWFFWVYISYKNYCLFICSFRFSENIVLIIFYLDIVYWKLHCISADHCSQVTFSANVRLKGQVKPTIKPRYSSLNFIDYHFLKMWILKIIFRIYVQKRNESLLLSMKYLLDITLEQNSELYFIF